MDRRRFLARFGAGAAGLMAFSRGGGTAFAQDYSKDYPLNCTPPLPGGTPQPVTLIKRSLVPRKSAFDLSAAEIGKLRDAYAALRNLSLTTPRDPRGWRHQANVHCYYCSGGYDSLGTEIHGGWWFLPWHRCYLYMHERILGALIGDGNFRLPYWDWDSIPDAAPNSRRTIPPAYDATTYDITQPSKLSIANALFDRTRGATSANVLPDEIVGKVAMTAAMCATDQNFTGGPGLMGSLESNPHGPVHIWTGDPRTDPEKQQAPFGCFFPIDYPYDPKDPQSFPADVSQIFGCTDMGVLGTAAQDPIFFSHHANIDRLWDIWLQIPGPGHMNPGPPDPRKNPWLANGWSFYDENKKWVTISVLQVLEEEKNLGYVYQPPQVTGYTTTSAICGPPPPARAAVTPAAAAQAPGPLSVADDQGGTEVGTKPHTRGVTLPADRRTGLQSRATGTDQRRYELHIDGVTVPPSGGVMIRVFLNLPSANAQTAPDPAHFVGYITVVPSGPGHHHPVVRNVAFDLTPPLAATAAATDQLSVTLVPVTAGGREPARGVVTYQSIYLTVK